MIPVGRRTEVRELDRLLEQALGGAGGEQRLPRGRVEVWPGSGHFAQLAHPRRFAERLAELG